MRTRMFRVTVTAASVLLAAWPLLLGGCRHGRNHCQTGACPECGSPYPAPQPAGVPAAPAAPAVSSYGGQVTCPVSGAVLGAAGPAVPVTVKGQTIYVCCQGCAAKVQADPDPYLARVASERSGGKGPAPAAGQAGPVAGPYSGQKTCPVTGERLDPDGSAIPVTVKGQTIYVCCQGCAAKVKRDPDRYLAKVAAERGQPQLLP